MDTVLKSGSSCRTRVTRPSGPPLHMAAMSAVMATGRECIDLGIATTPTVEMMVEKLGACGPGRPLFAVQKQGGAAELAVGPWSARAMGSLLNIKQLC